MNFFEFAASPLEVNLKLIHSNLKPAFNHVADAFYHT